MCKDCGISPGAMTDLKAGRKKILSAVNMQKLADYFGVSVDYLLGHNETKKQPAANSDELTDTQKTAIDMIKSMSDSDLEMYLEILKTIKKKKAD